MKETTKMLRERLTPVYGPGETQAIIRLIFKYLKDWTATDMIINSDRKLSAYTRERAAEICDRLLLGEPIQYITGLAHFMGMDLHVGPGVLIPRPETAELVDMVVDRYGEREDLRVLDIGTGSGCIAIALSRALKFAKVTAIDLSAEALKTARLNAEALKARIDFRGADLFTFKPSPESYDIIVSNPPYIEPDEKETMEPNVLEHEPHLALFVDEADPMRINRRIVELAAKALAPGGGLYIEGNPRHMDRLKEAMAQAGLSDATVALDSFGRRRFATAFKPEER